MAAADVQQPPSEPAPSLPDYLTSPDATLGDKDATWRYGKAPDYTKTRENWQQTKVMNHTAGSLPQLVENLVKNWEVEASFKPDLKDWRTIDHANYSFAINGGPPQDAEHMLKVGTYNAILSESDYYSPKNSDFSSSHKTFKRMMPTFAWEVTEVYSGPPKVAFKWRHWGVMKNDYVGFNDKGEKITAKAHGGPIEITGVTIATVNDKVQLQAVDTYFDPATMYKQIAPEGVVNRVAVDKKVLANPGDGLDMPIPELDGLAIAEKFNQENAAQEGTDGDKSQYANIKSREELNRTISNVLEQPASIVHPGPRDAELAVKPEDGEAVVAAAGSSETKLTHEEMSKISAGECPFMNRE